jgi:hypothetical protein
MRGANRDKSNLKFIQWNKSMQSVFTRSTHPAVMETWDDLPAGVPNLTLEFKYDHLGRRIQKVAKVDDTTVLDRRYAWMGRQLKWEVNSAGSVVKSYEWGPDLSQTMEGAGTVGGLLRVTDHGGAWESWLAFPCYDGNGNVMGLAGQRQLELASG